MSDIEHYEELSQYEKLEAENDRLIEDMIGNKASRRLNRLKDPTLRRRAKADNGFILATMRGDHDAGLNYIKESLYTYTEKETAEKDE